MLSAVDVCHNTSKPSPSTCAGANNLHLSVPIGSDGDRTAAFVAGPAAFPVGKATVYVVHALMADPTLITGKKQR